MKPTPGTFLHSDECLPVMRETRSPYSLRITSKWLAIGFAVVLLLVAFVPWQQSVAGSGKFTAYAPLERRQSLGAPVAGRVVHWYVSEGSRVDAGDRIVDIADNDPEILERMRRERDAYDQKLQASRASVLALTDRILGLRQSRTSALAAAENYVEMAKQTVRAAERKVDAAEQTLVTAELNLERVKRLYDKGLRSKRALELAELESAKSSAELDRARADLSATREDLHAKRAQRDKTEADTRATLESAKSSLASAESSVATNEAALQKIDSELARQSTMSVRAPRAGTVLRLLAQPGSEFVKTGEPLAHLVPDAQDAVVELWVKGNDMPLIDAGDRVRLQFEGWPAVQFVGWPSVAVGTFGGVVSLVDATDDGGGKFRILVKPDPDDEPWPSRQFLRQGVRTNGWVLLNVVPLWYELWRQFNGFPPVISIDEPLPVSKPGGK
jgi:adhesin transport system membrane fusion protein